ncbi:protein SFI1 homolog [Trichosurus vulpecula]|uniref:protein SFI1 homolog n=1 Tax=Trichosurus vulpecula TaxID=9337 RepID=UPI00186B1A14|nr:protein SFI1 homolog [Trichosurus vulpecula]
MSRTERGASSLRADARTEADLDFSQRGTKVTLGSKAKARALKKDAAGMHQSLKVPRSKVPSVPWRRTGHPPPNQLAYAWNRGGRLRELRIRCLARKFFFLWAAQTFGRVLPSRARHHYERRLLQKTFEDWREEWWVVRREWKLRVRADCQYRYSLYNLAFQAWQTYVRQRRDKKKKYRRAEDHAAKQKLWPAWKNWLIYVDVRRTKHEMHSVAQEFREQSVFRVPWRVWRRQVQKRRVGRTMDTLALQHWSISLQFWAWSQWQEQFLLLQIIRKKETEAVRHHARRERQRALTAWRGYLQGRREKRRQAQLAGQFHCAIMVQTGFLAWRMAWEQRKHLHAHQARIEALAARIALRQAFERWKRYMLISAEDAAFWDLAEKHHRQRLVLSCFRALEDNVKSSRLHQLRKNLAHGQYQAMLLQRFWRCWCARAEQREDERHLPQLLRAHDHYRDALLRKCLWLWSQNAQESRRKQMQSAKAEHHYRSRNLSVLFQAWKSFSLQRREQRVRRTEASSFHRELVKRWVFNTWWQKTCLQREARLSERMAVLHAERQVLRRYWSTWRWRTAELSTERGGQAMACAHYHHRQLQKTFQIWRENLQALQAQQAGEMRAAVFNSGLLIRWTWSKWQEYMALQNAKWQKVARADRHYRQMLLRRALTAWMTYQGRVKVILRQVAEREDERHRELLQQVFHLWRENTVAQMEEARKTLLAEEHYQRTILWKVAIRWRDTASLRIYFRQQEDMAVIDARKQLERGRLRALFQHWWKCGQRASLQRAQLQRATQHHGRRLLKACLAHWKKYHLECIRKMLLQRQSAQLMAQRLSRSSFSMWKCQLGEKQREQQATVRALWLWSFTLQGKVWDAWLGFVQEQRRKKARLERAALAYHDSLVHEGVTRLLRFVAGMKSFRGHFHAQQQAQVARNLHQVVHRCATLWKHKALAKDRSHFLGTASCKRVTFEVPITDAPPATAGEAAVDAEQSRAPQRPSKYWGWPLQLASGDPHLPDLNVVRPVRKQPRRPDFLLDSLERDSAAGHLCPGLLAETAMSLLPAQPSPSAALVAPGPSIRTGVGSRSLLKPQGHRPLHPEATSPPHSSMAGDRGPMESLAFGKPSSELPGPREPAAVVAERGCPQPGGHLLLPEGFLGSKGKPSLGLEASGGSQADTGRGALGILGDGGELEAELEEIQEKLFSYQANKQNLRSWQRQASSLRKWLALSMEDPRPEEEEAGRQVQQELHQVEQQIAHLVEELRAERQQVQRYAARLQVLRAAFSS